MKSAIAATLTTLLAIGLGTAFAGSPQDPSQQNMPASPATAQQSSNSPQNACSSKWPRFDQIDTKHAGYVSKKQVKAVPGLAKAFKKADANHDDKLSQAEYESWVQSQCSSMEQQSPDQMAPPLG